MWLTLQNSQQDCSPKASSWRRRYGHFYLNNKVLLASLLMLTTSEGWTKPRSSKHKKFKIIFCFEIKLSRNCNRRFSLRLAKKKLGSGKYWLTITRPLTFSPNDRKPPWGKKVLIRNVTRINQPLLFQHASKLNKLFLHSGKAQLSLKKKGTLALEPIALFLWVH